MKIFHSALNDEGVYLRPKMKFQPTIREILFTHCGQNETKFRFGWPEKNGLFSKCQSFLMEQMYAQMFPLI